MTLDRTPPDDNPLPVTYKADFSAMGRYCKKIRTDAGAWEQLEYYLSKHLDATFTHGACPECAKKIAAEEAVAIPNNE
jgi:hypothetical protein